MMSCVSLFVESDGLTLPDGTIFVGGFELKYQITHGDNGGDYMDVFNIYQIIGKDRIRISDPVRYSGMKKWERELAKHYEACGMKLWKANHSEWAKATYKMLVPIVD